MAGRAPAAETLGAHKVSERFRTLRDPAVHAGKRAGLSACTIAVYFRFRKLRFALAQIT